MTNNPQRGCGRLREGFYLQGGVGAKGILAPITVTLGNHTLDAVRGLTGKVEPRLIHAIDPEITLYHEDVRYLTESTALRLEGWQQTDKPQLTIGTTLAHGRLALLHHVGKRYYSPIAHMVETARYGPSLRTTKAFIKTVQRYLPLPIFFSFSDVPFFEHQRHLDSFMRQMVREEGPSRERTDIATRIGIPLVDGDDYDWSSDSNAVPYDYREWGGVVGQDHGTWHSVLKAMSYIERTKDLPPDVVMQEAVVYFSWVTKGVQVTKGDGTVDSDVAGLVDHIVIDDDGTEDEEADTAS